MTTVDVNKTETLVESQERINGVEQTVVANRLLQPDNTQVVAPQIIKQNITTEIETNVVTNTQITREIVSVGIQGPPGAGGGGILYQATAPAGASGLVWVRTGDYRSFVWDGSNWTGQERQATWSATASNNSFLSTDGPYAAINSTTGRQYAFTLKILKIKLNHKTISDKTFDIYINGSSGFNFTTTGGIYSGDPNLTVPANARIEIHSRAGSSVRKVHCEVVFKEIA